MALRPRGGSPGLTAAVVAFGILFFISLILAVVFFVQAGKYQTQVEAVDRDLRAFVSRTEMTQPEITALRGRGGTIVGKLLEQRQWAFRTISGDETAELEVIQSQVTEAGLAEGKALLTLVNELRTTLDQSHQTLQQQQAMLQQAAAELLQVQQRRQAQSQGFEAAVSQLQGNLDQQGAQFTAYQQRVSQEQRQLAALLEELRRSSEMSELEVRQRSVQLETENAALRRRISELTLSHDGESTALDPSLLPDGQIMAIDPRGRWVYIDRGRAHRVVLGMTFEVFEHAAAVADSGDGRGKATIQVVDIIENSSQCLVVRSSPGKTLQEGDVIANAVYSPDATFNFHVHGRFDVDDTGRTTDEDRRRIERMITQWGGRLMDELTYEVDFLVLGAAPAPPVLLADTIDPVEITRQLRLRAEYDRHQQLLERAREMSIPVLNQNRFLTLVGFFER